MIKSNDEAETGTQDEAVVVNPLFHAAAAAVGQDAPNDDNSCTVPIPSRTMVNFEIEAGPEIQAVVS